MGYPRRKSLVSRTSKPTLQAKPVSPHEVPQHENEWQAWAPFSQCARIPLDREPPVDQKLRSSIISAGKSSGPYELCIIHQHHEAKPSRQQRLRRYWDKDSFDSDSNSDSKSKDLDLNTWADEGFELTLPEIIIDDSPARLAWLALKEQGESNAPLDAITSIMGSQLEPIKEHFMLVRKRFVNARNVIPPKFFNLALRGGSKTSKRKIASLFAWFLKSLGIAEQKQTELELTLGRDGDMSLQLMETISKRSFNTIFIILVPKEEEFDAVCESKTHRFTFETTLSVPDYNHRSHDDLRLLVVRATNAKGISIDPADEEEVIDSLARQAAKSRLSLFDDANNVAGILDDACEKLKRRGFKNPGPEELLRRQWEAEWRWDQAARQLNESEPQRGRSPKVPLEQVSPLIANIPGGSKSPACLTLEDVVGPPVPDFKANNKSWLQLQSMTGLDNVKQEVAQMVAYAQRKRESERLGISVPRTFSLHRTFLGPPGVGKSTVAKLYGQLILDLGLVSGIDSRSGHHKEPAVVNPSHLIGTYIGQSERNTESCLTNAKGGVLIIDEAHMLYTSRANGENTSDVFRKAVVDTIVALVSAGADEDRCVILIGHPDGMEDMFLHTNPGLQRRFPKETAMNLEAYTPDQLFQIFSAKMNAENIVATDDALHVARQVMGRMRINPRFGNAGDVENLLATAQRRNLARNVQPTWASSPAQPLQLEPEDIDPRWNRLLNAGSNRASLFENYVGFEEITKKFEQYQNVVVGLKKRGVDPRAEMPWTLIFDGPPGTGKTATARKLGQLYYDLCLLSTDEVIECSVSDLIDTSGLKVTNMLEKSLGKVLFIDEAYRLEGTRAGALVTGELVDAVTKQRYARNLVIVLAGYSKEMDSLLGTNPGLRSRFPERIRFPALRPEECKWLLERELRRKGITIKESRRGAECRLLAKGFHRLRGTKAWASARDVETLARSIAKLVFAEEGRGTGGDASEMLTVSTAKVLRQMRLMYEERAPQDGDDAVPGQTRQDDSDAE